MVISFSCSGFHTRLNNLTLTVYFPSKTILIFQEKSGFFLDNFRSPQFPLSLETTGSSSPKECKESEKSAFQTVAEELKTDYKVSSQPTLALFTGQKTKGYQEKISHYRV